MAELRDEVERLTNAVTQERARRRVEAQRLENMAASLDERNNDESTVITPELTTAIDAAKAAIDSFKDDAPTTKPAKPAAASSHK